MTMLCPCLSFTDYTLGFLDPNELSEMLSLYYIKTTNHDFHKLILRSERKHMGHKTIQQSRNRSASLLSQTDSSLSLGLP